MPASVATLLVLDLILIVGVIWLVIAAFRVRAWWALIVLLPFGPLVFAVKHWPQARAPFLTMVISAGLLGGLLASQPELLARLKQPGAAYQHGSTSGDSAVPVPLPVTHAARYLAETAPAPADPKVAAQASYAKHLAEVTALYNQLQAERPNLKSGKATSDFNAEASRYQAALKTLAIEKTQLDAMYGSAVPAQKGEQKVAGVVHGTPYADRILDIEATATLDRLRLLATAGDYPKFGGLLQQCLSNYRTSSVFPQMVALGRQTLPNATPDKLTALIERQTDAARAETDSVTRQIQAIVNQTPPTVPKPPPGAAVYNYDYHPGATKPDFDHADPASTRELWQGDYVYIAHVPGVYYRSADCEFNPQTKYFFTSRDVPKKRLSDAEYRELTRLYRLLGQDEKYITAHAQRLDDVGQTSDALLALNAQLAALPAK